MRHHISRQAQPGKIYTSREPVALRPRESCQIFIGFHNMQPCPLRYELDPQAGLVTKDGLFTASDKQGIHTIRVTCEHDPLISTFVSLDVKEEG